MPRLRTLLFIQAINERHYRRLGLRTSPGFDEATQFVGHPRTVEVVGQPSPRRREADEGVSE